MGVLLTITEPKQSSMFVFTVYQVRPLHLLATPSAALANFETSTLGAEQPQQQHHKRPLHICARPADCMLEPDGL